MAGPLLIAGIIAGAVILGLSFFGALFFQSIGGFAIFLILIGLAFMLVPFGNKKPGIYAIIAGIVLFVFNSMNMPGWVWIVLGILVVMWYIRRPKY